MSQYSSVWKIVYAVYPPFLRILERLGFHAGRQPYVLGFLDSEYRVDVFRSFLQEQGYESAKLAWKDTGEILNMRKIDKGKYQWHLRMFFDREIRGHYEYSPEGNPWGHIRAADFRPADEYFLELLKDKLQN